MHLLRQALNAIVERLGYEQAVADLFLLPILGLAWFAPRFGDRIFTAIERFGTTMAARKRLTLVAIAAAAILIRLSLLPVLPVPIPRVQDEFSYLLAADTFAHGHLTNPTHPLWVFFDTVHVNQHDIGTTVYHRFHLPVQWLLFQCLDVLAKIDQFPRVRDIQQLIDVIARKVLHHEILDTCNWQQVAIA